MSPDFVEFIYDQPVFLAPPQLIFVGGRSLRTRPHPSLSTVMCLTLYNVTVSLGSRRVRDFGKK